MKYAQEFTNVSQLLINSLVEGINLHRHYCFQPNEAKQIIRVLDLFCDIKLKHVYVSFFNNPKIDQTISITVYKTDICYPKPLINYQSKDVEVFLESVRIGKTPSNLRELVRINFF